MEMTLCCPCLFGLEALVAQELKEMGCKDVRAENGRVLFSGNMRTVATANINSRFAERVQILVGQFEAQSFTELFDQVKALPWEAYLYKDDAFPVSGSCLSSQLHSVPDCQAIIKKAIVERLKQSYKTTWFTESGSMHRIKFLLIKDRISIAIDTTGDGLHKRGYRKISTSAPIKETLAAAMVKLARLRPDGYMIDPFCGSGTILVEGAMQAMHIAPGVNRVFSAQEWQQVDRRVWREAREEAEAKRVATAFCAQGYDIDPGAVTLTLENAKKAGVSACVRAEMRPISRFKTETQYGDVICNPPYGERLLDIQTAREIYQSMGQLFTAQKGWSYSIISSEEEFEKYFGRSADKRRKLYNGMIKCQLYQYFKYKK